MTMIVVTHEMSFARRVGRSGDRVRSRQGRRAGAAATDFRGAARSAHTRLPEPSRMVGLRQARKAARNGTDLALVRPRRRGALADARQAGATGIVTALHQIPYGVVWTIDEIEKPQGADRGRPSLGLRWSVVESLPIAERDQARRGRSRAAVRELPPVAAQSRRLRYRRSSATTSCRSSTGRAPIWLAPLPGGGTSLKFDAHEVLRVRLLHARAPRRGGRPRAGGGRQGPPMVRHSSPRATRRQLLANVMAGLPGAFDRYDIPKPASACSSAITA